MKGCLKKLLWLWVMCWCAAVCAARVPEAESILWQVSRSGSPHRHYLMGTVHIGKAQQPLPTGFQAALDGSALLLVETKAGSLSYQRKNPLLAVQMAWLIYGSRPLSETLGEKRLLLIRKRLREIGQEQDAEIFHSGSYLMPWAASMMLLASAKPEGYSSEYGVDAKLMRRAEAAGKRVADLETASYSLEPLTKLPEDVILRDLDATLRRPLKHLIRERRHLAELYYSGRVGELWRQLQPEHSLRHTAKQDLPLWRDFLQVQMLQRRNHHWLPKITAAFAEQNTAVAVGTAHLFGEDGLIVLLRGEGYTVEPVFKPLKPQSP